MSTKEEARATEELPGRETHHGLEDTQRDYSASNFVAHTDKRFATARARLALRSYALHIVDRGLDSEAGFMVCRWDRSVVLKDWPALERFMQMVGA